jgi:hypothetical protein
MNKLHALFAVALAACAGAVVAGPLAEMSIIDRSTGEHLQTWEHQGRIYVVGRPGDRYAIEIRSHAQERLLAVLSVDGVNAITGQTAAGNQSGYILEARQRAEILGWRKTMDDVAAFYFTALPDSYAARTGRPDNVGVIGAALYREYVEAPVVFPVPPRIYEPQSSVGAVQASPAPKYKSSVPQAAGDRNETSARRADRLGTGHGERVAASTQYADFRRASDQPVKVMTIYYDSYANLVAQGVIAGPRSPRPFPGGFVPDPGC